MSNSSFAWTTTNSEKGVTTTGSTSRDFWAQPQQQQRRQEDDVLHFTNDDATMEVDEQDDERGVGVTADDLRSVVSFSTSSLYEEDESSSSPSATTFPHPNSDDDDCSWEEDSEMQVQGDDDETTRATRTEQHQQQRPPQQPPQQQQPSQQPLRQDVHSTGDRIDGDGEEEEQNTGYDYYFESSPLEKPGMQESLPRQGEVTVGGGNSVDDDGDDDAYYCSDDDEDIVFPDEYRDEPRPADVICGRGGASNNHAGTSRYRKTAKHLCRAYNLKTTTNTAKNQLAQMIIHWVHHDAGGGGWFIRKDKKTKRWLRLTNDQALKKVKQYLREN